MKFLSTYRLSTTIILMEFVVLVTTILLQEFAIMALLLIVYSVVLSGVAYMESQQTVVNANHPYSYLHFNKKQFDREIAQLEKEINNVQK